MPKQTTQLTAEPAEGNIDRFCEWGHDMSSSPSLERYSRQILSGILWKRPLLSRRDRSIMTLAVLIARNQSAELLPYLELALAEGVRPFEISGLLAHLAFYSGWGNALAADKVIRQAFDKAGITQEQLVPQDRSLHEVDAAAERRRHAVTLQKFGGIAPGLVQLTHDVLFGDLWLQPELSVRDRCLVTICSVIATAQTAQLAFYLNRAMDHGVSRSELSELMTHVAFYSGWSSVYTALAVARDVCDSRPDHVG